MNPNIASVQTNAEGEKQVQNRLLSSSFFSWAGQHYGNAVVLQ